MPRNIAVLAVLLLATGPAVAEAQEQSEPTHLVVRYFQCSPQGEALEYFQEWRPIVQQMIDEGRFVDYGILAHAWGDEWNISDYFAIDDLDGFFGNSNELIRRIRAAAEGGAEDEVLGEPARRPFFELCTAHKDNIYRIVPGSPSASN